MSKTAVVTGSSGGIGGAVSQALMGAGWRVIGLDLVSSEQIEDEIVVDLGDDVAISEAARNLSQEPSVGLIVHAAANQVLEPAGSTSPAQWHSVLNANVISLDVLVGACLPALKANQGAVVGISSVHATATTCGIAAYATSKAALEGWVRAAARDLGPEVTVNAIAPGAIDTPMLRDGFSRWSDEEAQARMDVLTGRTPLERIGTPEEIAEAVLYLSTARFVTGSVLRVDGGALSVLGSE